MKPSRDFPGDGSKYIWSAPLTSAMVTTLIALAPCPAGAQDTGDRPGLQILVTPYFWAPEVTVRVKTPIPQIPTVKETVGFDQLFNHLSWIPFMGTVEFRDGRFGAVFDYTHTPLRTGITTRNVFFNGGT